VAGSVVTTWAAVRRTLVLVSALCLVGVACSDGDDTSDTATTVAPAGGTAATPGSDDAAAASNDECTSAHAQHVTMMWNPTMADEMTNLGCPWPYEPYLAEPTGAEPSPEITAPFEVRTYSELWTLLGAARVGTCGVAPLADPAGDAGFTFGFTYSLAEAGCPAGTTAELEVREYVSAGDRDAAALDHEEEHVTVVVLGRWSIALSAISPSGDAVVDQVAAGLVGAGGQQLGS
jgi:hypothetical protein